MSGKILAVQNYLVPASGKVGVYVVRETLTAGVPLQIDFRSVNLDGDKFWPYGLYIDNTEGSAECAVTLDQVYLTLSCAAGTSLTRMYPGVEDQSVTIEGEGDVTLLFANFPVFGNS